MLVVRAAWPPAPWRPPLAGRAGAAPARAAGGGAIGTRAGLGAGAGAAAGAAATGAGAGVSTAGSGAGADGAAGGATSTGVTAAGLWAGGAGGGAAGAATGGATGALATGAAAGAGADGAGPSARAAGTPMPGRTGLGGAARFFTTSTCTVLDRPWLKDWRTLPASTVLPSSRRPPGRRLSLLLPASCSFWSLIRRFEPDHLIHIKLPHNPDSLGI